MDGDAARFASEGGVKFIYQRDCRVPVDRSARGVWGAASQAVRVTGGPGCVGSHTTVCALLDVDEACVVTQPCAIVRERAERE